MTIGSRPGPAEEISFNAAHVLPKRGNGVSVLKLDNEVLLYHEDGASLHSSRRIYNGDIDLGEVGGPLALSVALVGLQTTEELSLKLDRYDRSGHTLRPKNRC